MGRGHLSTHISLLFFLLLLSCVAVISFEDFFPPLKGESGRDLLSSGSAQLEKKGEENWGIFRRMDTDSIHHPSTEEKDGSQIRSHTHINFIDTAKIFSFK